MSEISEPAETSGHVLDVPASAWALAWSFVAGQVLELARRGTQSEEAWPLSMVLGVLVVTLFAHGVMRVRWIRFWVVVVLVTIAPVGQLFVLTRDPSGWVVVALALSLLQAGLLHRYTRTEWFRLQRDRTPGGPSLTPILLIAALVGALGGMLGADQAGIGSTITHDDSYDDPFAPPFGDHW
jgi:hypothetical protein